MKEARKDNPSLVLSTNGSKLDQGQVAAAVYWEENQPPSRKKKANFWGKIKLY